MLDALIIGGGAFGLHLAARLARRFDEVEVCEAGSNFLSRASYANQARVHNGYHYPRSILTGLRSHLNYARFLREYGDCVDQSFTKLYAVGRLFSSVSADQFVEFANRIGAPIKRAPESIRGRFYEDLVEDVFTVEEAAFNASILRDLLVDAARDACVRLSTSTTVRRVRTTGDSLAVDVETHGGKIETRFCRRVFNCTYSGLNDVIVDSGLPPVPLKYELAELCLVDVPKSFGELGVTIMCGPFFSCMPFPAEGCHSLSHVRYTPHFQWHETTPRRPIHEIYRQAAQRTGFPQMVRDASRYMPELRDIHYRRSLWEIKALLPKSEFDDSRPILFQRDYGFRNHHLLLGGKIDNVFDVADAIDKMLDIEH